MDFHDQLSLTLRRRPFHAPPASPLFPTLCLSLHLYLSSYLHQLFGPAAPTYPSHPSSSSSPHLWNSFPALPFQPSRSNFWFNNHPFTTSPFTNWNHLSNTLSELLSAPLCIEELFRVVTHAQHFMHTCRSPDWWSVAVTIGAATQVLDVHIHDLLWCVTGLHLALLSIRGANPASLRSLTRLRIAQCYATFKTLSFENSAFVRDAACDYEDLVTNVRQMKQNYDEMNFVKKKIMSLEEKLKQETICFLSQKLTPPSFNTEERSKRTPPQNMQIRIEDLIFASPPRLVGRGSFGSVYEAYWLGRKVAAKQFAHDSGKQLFEHEAAVLAELQCPFVVQMFGWCVDSQNNACYLVLELASNNLTSFVAERSRLNKSLGLPVVVDLMLQISRGMEYMHSRKIMHRDLKPGNVLVQPISSCRELRDKGYARVKLCDFGLAKLKLETHNSMTWQVGTMCYMAPEVWAPVFRNTFSTEGEFERASYSFQADVYSFAMTFAYTLTGKQPFADIRSGTELLEMLGEGVRPELPADCPRFFKEFIRRCWSNNPSSRPSFSDISMVLRHLKLQLMRSRIPEQPSACLSDDEIFLSSPTLSYQELSDATNGFTKSVQNITLDSICSGVLSDGMVVLVHHKRSLVSPGEVWAEVSLMFDLRHSNVVSLRAVCIHCSQCWFVYEYTCPRGSLDVWLENALDQSFKPSDEKACYRVAVGVACGLQYLHDQNALCAVTSKNILLDERFEPQILIDSSVCKEKTDRLTYHQCLDVVHFKNLIGQLILYLQSIGLDLENKIQFPYASLLKEVECFCLGNRELTMDEVVQMLLAKIDCLP